jgi:hypothetical protein
MKLCGAGNGPTGYFAMENKFTGMIPVVQDNRRLSASFSSVLMMALLI